jgi:hypothetical protein
VDHSVQAAQHELPSSPCDAGLRSLSVVPVFALSSQGRDNLLLPAPHRMAIREPRRRQRP